MNGPDIQKSIAETLIQQGTLGIIALALCMTVYMLWKKHEEWIQKYDELQDKRVAERDILVKALVESTQVIGKVTEFLAYRRRPGGGGENERQG